jgi:PST family polysaccharide transporter
VNADHQTVKAGQGDVSSTQSANNGLFVSILSKSGAQLVNLAGLAVLARLLVPEDFGLVAMVMAVVGLGQLFKDSLGHTAIRAARLDISQINSLFWISSALGAALAVVVYGAAPWVAALYQDSRLLDVTRITSVSFLLSGVATIPMALIRRRLAFARLAMINVSVAVATQLSGIGLALAGYGYWALVVAAVVGALVSMIMALIWSEMRLDRPMIAENLRPLLGFGGHVVVFGLMGFLALNAHSLILGIYQDAASVGYYHRAFMIMMLFVAQLSDPLTTVVTPTLARLQDDLAAYRAHYLESLRLFVMFASALSALLYACADEIVHILLGSGWQQSIDILKILAVGIVPQVLCISTGWLYFSNGDTRSLMWWGIGGWGTLILLLFLAASGGMRAIALSYTVGMFILLLPCLKMALRRCGLPVSTVLAASFPAVVSAGTGFIIIALLDPKFAGFPAVLRILITSVVFAMIYLPLILLVFRQKRVLLQLLPSLRRRVSA